MEEFDVVDPMGRPTGQIVSRREAHAQGLRHRTAHVWITRQKDGADQVLLQKRAEEKDSFPGCYDTSSAGHIPAGCEPVESALRELQEELGIQASPEELTFLGCFHIQYEQVFHGKLFRDNEVSFVYYLRKDIEPDAMQLQISEVSEVKWFDIPEVIAALSPRNPAFCVPAQSFQMLTEALGG